MTDSQPTFTLVSFDLCPFVQRSSITLQHKGVEHDIRARFDAYLRGKGSPTRDVEPSLCGLRLGS